MHVFATKMQVVVGAGVRGKPEALLNVLAVSAEARKNVLVIFGDDVGDGFTFGHDDLKIFAVDPHASLKIALILLDGFGSNVKEVASQLIDLLAADVGDIVFRKFGASEDEGLDVADVVEVLLADGNALETVRRSKGDLLEALAFGSKDNVAGHAIFAIDHAALVVDGLDGEGLGVGVIVSLFFEFGFAFAETFDDFVDRLGGWFVGDGIVSGGMELLWRSRFTRSGGRGRGRRRAGARIGFPRTGILGGYGKG